MKPFSTDKGKCNQKITLVDGDNIVSDEKDIAEYLNCFFDNAVKSLELPKIDVLLDKGVYSNINNPIDIIVNKFRVHPSIMKIREMISGNTTFQIKDVRVSDVNNEIRKLN